MRLIAFDVSGIFWNAAMGGAGKDDVEAPFRLTCDTIRNLSDGYDRVVIAVDAPTCFRSKLLPSYKGNRPERYEWQWEQLRRVLAWAEQAGHHVLRADDFEADDVLMTVAAWCAANNYHCAVVSNDKDMAAVLGTGPDVALWRKNPKTGGWVAWTAEQFEQTKGFHPVRMPDFLALCGDSADNFKFFDGVADVTATRLVQAYSSLDAVNAAALAATDEAPLAVKVSAKVLDALRQDYATVYCKALQIATPRTDAPVDLASLDAPRPVTLGQAAPSREPDDADGNVGATRSNEAIRQAPAKVHDGPARPEAALVVPRRDERYELAPYELQPQTFNEVWQRARLAIEAGILPQWGRPEQAATVILLARERGIPAMTALQNAHVVKGRVGWSAAMLASMVLQDPECEYFEIIESTPTQATVASKQRGRPEKRLTYTLAEAKQAGLVVSGSQWEKRPATMCRWAAFREGARAFWPHRTTGMYTPGELRERFDAADAEVETAGEVQ
jgi:5'-3' exonuclease